MQVSKKKSQMLQMGCQRVLSSGVDLMQQALWYPHLPLPRCVSVKPNVLQLQHHLLCLLLTDLLLKAPMGWRSVCKICDDFITGVPMQGCT